MTIYNEYLTGEERERAIEEASLENEYSKLSTLFEMTTLQGEQMVRDAELKVFSESGTYDDLEFLFQEANEETDAKQKNIILKLIDVIRSMITSAKNAIVNFFKKGNKEQECEVPKEAVEKVSVINKLVNQVQTGISKIQNGDWSGAGDILKGISIPVVGAGAVGAGAVAVVKMKKGDADKHNQKLNSVLDKITGWLKTIETKLGPLKDTAIAKSICDKIKSFQSLVQKVSEMFMTGVKNASNSVKGAVDTAVDGVKNIAGKGNKKETKSFTRKNSIWHVFSDGTVTAEDKKTGKPKIVNMGSLPPEVKKAVDAIKNTTVEESVGIEDLLEILGGGYTIEMVDEGDSIIISESTEEIPVETSLFGIDMSDEIQTAESASDDDDFDALLGLINSL